MLTVLDENNIIRTADQENCCEKGGIGARYYRCMQLYKDNIAQVDKKNIKTIDTTKIFRLMQKVEKPTNIHLFLKEALGPLWR